MDPTENLCIHDPRSPYYTAPESPEDYIQEARNGCACDNCFYGRDAMALEIFALRARVAELEAENYRPAWIAAMKERDQFRDVLAGIASANYREWDEGLNTLQSFHDWAVNVARHAINA